MPTLDHLSRGGLPLFVARVGQHRVLPYLAGFARG